MRGIEVTFNMDGVPTRMRLRKMAQQRRFQVIINKETSEYIISDETNKIEHYEGLKLNDDLFIRICALIGQYFPNTRAIKKIDEDDYADYDDN